MKVQLMLTCLCDAFYGEVGIATVRVLEHCGVEVVFPEGQTCCGQPPFNSGDWHAARSIAGHTLATFDAALPIVTPSASCAAMWRHGYSMMGVASSHRVYELSEYLLDALEVSRWPLRGSRAFARRTVTLHQSCHGRALHLGDRQRRLLAMVPGLTVLEPAAADQCCGFGGAFAVTHERVSAEIGMDKLRCMQEAGPETVVGGDMGCLMQLQGLAERHQLPLRFRHFAQILAEAIG